MSNGRNLRVRHGTSMHHKIVAASLVLILLGMFEECSDDIMCRPWCTMSALSLGQQLANSYACG
jgi:hypothetical protein